MRAWGRNKFLDWPDAKVDLPIEEVIEAYKSGFMGAKPTPENVRAEFEDSMQWPDAERAIEEFDLAGDGAGKLVMPFVHVLEMFPGCMPGRVGQGRGDCVSWSSRNGMLTTMVCDILTGKPDEKTGQPEGPPDVSVEGIADGVLSTESLYWHRGHGGEGWFCPEAATISTTKSGLWVRKLYPELNLDLTRYSSQTAGIYGSRSPGSEIVAEGQKHLIHQATDSTGRPEARRDLLANGYGCSTCGGESFSETRDENGVSERTREGWAHAIAEIAFDDRPIAHQRYGGPLELLLNSWAKYNRGPRDIMESASLVPPEKKQDWIAKGIVNPATGNIMIPEGSFWSRTKDVSRRNTVHFSGANGFPSRVRKLEWPW